jgi:imidazolonepropionase-like amidohydrolase/GNAT superfamily N-acetyltransferase
MEDIFASLKKSACFYDVITDTWYHIKDIAISGEVFSCVESEAHIYDTENFDIYILPGFIDAHCHILENPYEPGSQPLIHNENYCTLLHRAGKNAATAVISGVTSLKDMGGRNYLSIDIVKQLNAFPIRLSTAGCYFTSPNGHCSDRGAVVIRTSEDFISGINCLTSQNIKFCKIIHSDDGFDYKILTQMITMAHDRGMFVSCHAYTEKAAREATVAGTDCLEHVGDYSDELLQLIKDKGVIVVPTFVAACDSTPDNCGILSDVDKDILKQWLDGEKTVIPKLFAYGINVALGTDSGFPGTPCNSLSREIQLLHNELGVPMKQLLYAAFVVTPRTILMSEKLGRIAPGYFADFQCFRRNPLLNIEDLGHPHEVWVGGRKVDFVTPESVVIRRLVKSDIVSISSYLHYYYFDCGTLDDFWSDEEISCWISNEEDYCTGAFYGGGLIGFCLTHYHKEIKKVHLENVYVIEGFRTQDIARKLLLDAINHYKNPSSRIRFVGLVDIENYPAICLLEKNKFTKGHPTFWMQRNVENND